MTPLEQFVSNQRASRSLCILIYIHVTLGTFLICLFFSDLASPTRTWTTGKRPKKGRSRRHEGGEAESVGTGAEAGSDWTRVCQPSISVHTTASTVLTHTWSQPVAGTRAQLRGADERTLGSCLHGAPGR